LGDAQGLVGAILGLLAPDSRIEVGRREEYAEELRVFLRTTTPPSPERSVIVVDSADVAPLFTTQIAFWHPTSNIGLPIPFQLSLSSLPTSRSSSLVFDQLELEFNDGSEKVIVSGREAKEGEGEGKVESYKLGEDGLEGGGDAWLGWRDGTTKVFCGMIRGRVESELTLSTATLTIKEGNWTIKLILRPELDDPRSPLVWHVLSKTPPTTVRLRQENPRICSVRPRSLKVKAEIRHDSPAYLGEQYKIRVDVTNEDEVEVEVFLDILLQPGEDDSRNTLSIDSHTSSSLIKAVSLGTLSPSSTLSKTFCLHCVGSPGDRQLDVSIRSQPTLLGSPSAVVPSSTEILQTLTIPALAPVFAAFDTHFHKKRRAVQHLLDFEEPTGWEGASDVTMVAKFCAAGPWELEVVGLRLDCVEAPDVRVVSSSVKGDVPLDLSWRPHDYFNVIYRLEVMAAVSDEDASIPSRPSLEILWRRKGDTFPPTRTTLPISLRPLQLTPTISVRLPPYMKLHQPTSLSYLFSNPTDRVLTLSMQIDSAEGFVFAGPRKTPSVILAPSEERTFNITVIPLVVGPCVVPRVRVFEIERISAEDELAVRREGDVPPPEAPKMKELAVVEESAVGEVAEPSQAHLETDLR
ncbi:trafficking protein particle complex subunit 11, partial [Phenoliferia sp. Uapishka_3]